MYYVHCGFPRNVRELNNSHTVIGLAPDPLALACALGSGYARLAECMATSSITVTMYTYIHVQCSEYLACPYSSQMWYLLWLDTIYREPYFGALAVAIQA